ncbi:MAG TPA: guanylate kinase [Candidatus Dormibacteraeota bacterium]|nr:guanylate kinase [Candidatus Dormibacteraeota bacterium]
MIPSHKPIVYIISAPSGSGKSTLVNELLKLVPRLDFSVSYTTRAPRGSEQNGKQYHFVPREEFERMIRDDEFLEWANFDGNYYGTARRFLEETGQKGHDLLLDIDVQGAQQIKQKLPEAVSIFVLPPDRKTLEWRLRKRSEDAEDVIARRLIAASREIENYDKYDYILINDDLEESIDRLEAIVLSERLSPSKSPRLAGEEKILELAERQRLANIKDRVQPILASFGAPPPSARS